MFTVKFTRVCISERVEHLGGTSLLVERDYEMQWWVMIGQDLFTRVKDEQEGLDFIGGIYDRCKRD